MSSLGRSIAMNFSGQFVARIISFTINMYLLRVVDNDVLGLVNVRLSLLYNTILFLTREPMRKANTLNASLPCFVNLIWLSPLIAFALSVLCTSFWLVFSSNHNLPNSVLIAFPASAIIESFAEPFAVVSLRFSMLGHFAIAQSLLILLQRVFVFAIIFLTSVQHLYAFACAQILASSAYTLFHYIAFWYHTRCSIPDLTSFPSFRWYFPQPSHGVDGESLSALGTLFAHSVLKQLMTDGSAYIMTFTESLSLKSQAVYDAVEKIGSLVARIVLAPLEEMCFAYFSNTVNQNSKGKNSSTYEPLVVNFSNILHVTCVIGVVVSVFGLPYSPLAVFLYGGRLLSENSGALLLSLYCIYLSVLAVNGITECFAMATMNNKQVFSHGGFLLVSAVVHLMLTYTLCAYFYAAGFILANTANMLFRIAYSWQHIRGFLGDRTPSITSILPTFSTMVVLLFALVACLITLVGNHLHVNCQTSTDFAMLNPAFSIPKPKFGNSTVMKVFGSTPGLSHTAAHLAIGGVMFVLVVAHIASSDHVFRIVVHKLPKYSQ